MSYYYLGNVTIDPSTENAIFLVKYSEEDNKNSNNDIMFNIKATYELYSDIHDPIHSQDQNVTNLCKATRVQFDLFELARKKVKRPYTENTYDIFLKSKDSYL